MNKFNGTITSKLPGVETSIFAVMSGFAIQHKAINLSDIGGTVTMIVDIYQSLLGVFYGK